ncbi:MAG: S41 family peptidase [Pirellulaceae bacterium]|nr:S41 family peptidase [Pirellulaceae bacterium]
MQYPDIHGDSIVFSYENDLWLVSSQGGVARRITTFPGKETMARFSPDGNWIAFTASYEGGSDAYLMPADGGEPKRLTYSPGGAQVLGWTPDGSRVVMRSFMETFIYRDPNLYFVSRDGSAPERFPIDRGVLCSFSPDGTRMLYCRKGREEYQWKRYKGGQYCDIWMYDFTSRTFTPISDYVGKNAYPLWIGERMFFVSDRDGVSNLYVQDLFTRAITRVTHYDTYDVMMPDTDGARIVFVQDGYLHVLNCADGSDTRISVEAPSDRWQIRTRVINPRDYVQGFDASEDGGLLAVEARGDLFVVPADKDAQTKNLSDSPGTRERLAQVSPDGKQVAFFSDRTGSYQLYLQSIEGGEWTALTTSLDRTPYRPAWSPDGTKILFGTKDFACILIDVATREMVTIAESRQLKNDQFYWEIDDYAWSPDSRWVCYTTVAANRNSQVFLFGVDEKKTVPLTDDFYDNLNPCFDANGEYLYFLSSRGFDVQMDFHEDNHVLANPYQVMAVQLQAGRKPPFLANEAKGQPAEAAPAEKRIDIDGIASRIFPLPVPAGNYFYLRAGQNKVAWCSVPRFSEDEYEEVFKPRGATKWTLHIFDMTAKEMRTVEDKIASFALSVNGQRLVCRADRNIFLTTLQSAFDSRRIGDAVNLDRMVYRVDNQAEWQQIFSDVWRWYDQFFYDADMHGHDWKAIGERYRQQIPHLSSREELNWLISQMVGELCVGHTYITGGDMGPSTTPATPLFTGLLGADLVADPAAGRYRFERIYGPTEYNLDLKAPLARPDIQVKAGDFLIKINGQPVGAGDDYWKLLQVVEGQKVKLLVNDTPQEEGAREYEIAPLRNDRDLRYNHWLAENIRKVLAATDGRVGYMHINAMGAAGIGEFDKFWRAFRYKDGIIIDVRRNSGGWTEYFMIDKLERQQVAFNVLRGMEPFRYPGTAGNLQYVAVSNEYNGSDGECFLEHFKARKLGTVVGVPSWGGLVGILNPQPTIDNGTIQQPNNAFFGREGTWWVENHGADPDIVVDNDPASVVAGRDPQLEKAIEVILQEIRDRRKRAFPDRPPYPKR